MSIPYFTTNAIAGFLYEICPQINSKICFDQSKEHIKTPPEFRGIFWASMSQSGVKFPVSISLPPWVNYKISHFIKIENKEKGQHFMEFVIL